MQNIFAVTVTSLSPDAPGQLMLGLDVSRVNVKAKTAEKLGPVGQSLSMEARAAVILF